jgi:hypothetical protein
MSLNDLPGVDSEIDEMLSAAGAPDPFADSGENVPKRLAWLKICHPLKAFKIGARFAALRSFRAIFRRVQASAHENGEKSKTFQKRMSSSFCPNLKMAALMRRQS